jgi:hypothetical protein
MAVAKYHKQERGYRVGYDEWNEYRVAGSAVTCVIGGFLDLRDTRPVQSPSCQGIDQYCLAKPV